MVLFFPCFLFVHHLLSKESKLSLKMKKKYWNKNESDFGSKGKLCRLKMWKSFFYLGWKYTENSTPINIQMKPTLFYFPQSRLLRNTNHEQNKKKKKFDFFAIKIPRTERKRKEQNWKLFPINFPHILTLT